MVQLKKELSFKAILLITINSILGTGIFFLPAIGAQHAGPASVLSWLIMAIIAMYIGMCFAELSSMFPTAGGIYEFCKQAYGRFPSFLIGWTTIIAGNITIAMLVVGAIQYIFPHPVLFITIPLSLLFVFVFNYIAYRGLKTSAFMLITFAVITLIALFALIIPGFITFNPGNFKPFIPFATSSIFIAIFFIAETFFGWETATFLAEETKDGQKIMPKALLWGTAIIGIIALLVVITSLSAINWQIFGMSTAPLTDLSRLHYGPIGAYIITMLVYLAIIGAVAGWIVSAPRLLLAMARDNLFLKQLAEVHPVRQTPAKAILFQTIITTILVFVGAGSYQTLLHMLVPVVLVLYSAVLISMVVMRFTKPKVKRYYTAPFGTWMPIVVVLFLLSLIVGWWMEQHNAWQLVKMAALFVALGIPVYFLLEMYYDKYAIRKIRNWLAHLAWFTERIALPRWRVDYLVEKLGTVKNKKVFEYGCSVGTLTLDLCTAVSTKGKVYATDLSEKRIEIAKKRHDKRGHDHVVFIHDPQHTERAHPHVKKVDAVVSAGMMSYVKNPVKVLKHINKKLKKGGRIALLDYDKFFFVIPNIEWMSKDDKIKEIFKKAGFTVTVERRRGIAWQYVYIYGRKK